MKPLHLYITEAGHPISTSTLNKQMSAQTRDMNWGYYDPIRNRFSKED